jgi:hypothetical protein
MNTQDKIKVMQAYADGRQIQAKAIYEKDFRDWENTSEPRWNWDMLMYRVKPGPREFWLGLHKGNDYSCIRAVKTSSSKLDLNTCSGDEIIKVREVLD